MYFSAALFDVSLALFADTAGFWQPGIAGEARTRIAITWTGAGLGELEMQTERRPEHASDQPEPAHPESALLRQGATDRAAIGSWAATVRSGRRCPCSSVPPAGSTAHWRGGLIPKNFPLPGGWSVSDPFARLSRPTAPFTGLPPRIPSLTGATRTPRRFRHGDKGEPLSHAHPAAARPGGAGRALAHRLRSARRPAEPVLSAVAADDAGRRGSLDESLEQFSAQFTGPGRSEPVAAARFCVEFRHPSWVKPRDPADPARHDAALCWSDRRAGRSGRSGGPLTGAICVCTRAPHSPGPTTGRQALRTWITRISGLFPPEAEVFAYFNNDQHAAAPADADALMDLAEQVRLANPAPGVGWLTAHLTARALQLGWLTARGRQRRRPPGAAAGVTSATSGVIRPATGGSATATGQHLPARRASGRRRRHPGEASGHPPAPPRRSVWRLPARPARSIWQAPARPGLTSARPHARPGRIATSAGTSSDRATTASITMPAAIATATSLNCWSGISASRAKLVASASPATVIAREASDPATAIASRSGLRSRFLPDPADDEHVVVSAERDQQHGDRERHVVHEAVIAEAVLEDPDRDAERCSSERTLAASK